MKEKIKAPDDFTKDIICDFGDALYHAICPFCESKLEWEAEFDADGTVYHAYCCNWIYTLHQHTVRISAELEVEEDEPKLYRR